MSDFINKVVTVILIVILLVLAPLLNNYTQTESISKRVMLNEVQQFIDKVTDKRSVTEEDLNQLYLDLNSHGIIVDVTVKRLIRVASLIPGNKLKTVYFSAEDMTSANNGDVIQVTVSEVGISPGRKLLYSMLKIDQGKFEFTLAGAVG